MSEKILQPQPKSYTRNTFDGGRSPSLNIDVKKWKKQHSNKRSALL